MKTILYYYRLGKAVYKYCHSLDYGNDADLGAAIRHEVRVRRK